MRIAIIKLSALGDIIHSMVILQYIKKTYPNAYIEWIVEERFCSVLQNNPHIDSITTVDLKSLKKNKSITKLIQEIKKIRSLEKFDVVIDLQGLLKSSIITQLIKATNKWGFDKLSIREPMACMFYDKMVNIAYSENIIKRNIYLASNALNLDLDIDTLLDKNPFLYSVSSFDKIDDFVVFVIGASTKNKMYPKEKFIELAGLIDKEIYAVWGSKEEEEIADYLTYFSSIKKAPQLSLDGLKSFVSQAKLVIGGDTGPTHMAWALNIPSITIFGNTPEYRNTMQTKINKTIKSNSRVDPLRLDKKDFSIQEIEPKDIYEIAKEFL